MENSRNRPSSDDVPDLPGRLRARLTAAGVDSGARLVLALSGGVDSVVLLHLLHRLRPEFGYRLESVHVHHGLSPNADHWQAVCAAHCGRLGISLESVAVNVARNHPLGTEAAARQARYAVLDARPTDWLVLGHHQDDQAETLLFRLLRGTGLRGAGAMRQMERPPGKPPRLRPLLETRRREIEAWARHHGLHWVEDESNADVRYARNRLRADVLPVLEAAFPAAVPALVRAAGHFQEASDLLDEVAAQDAASCGGADWSLAVFLTLSRIRQRNLLRWAVRRRGAPTPESARLAEALRQIHEVRPGHALCLPLGEWAVAVFRGRLWLEPAGRLAPSPVALSLNASGVPEGGAFAWGAGQVVFEPASGRGVDSSRLVGAPAVLEPPAPGLRMRQGVGRPSRSFKNLCQEAGLPAWWRGGLPVLRVAGEVAWVGGVGVAAEFACPVGAPGVVPHWQPWGALG